MFVNSSKVKTCVDIFVKNTWFFHSLLCCELKPLLWSTRLTVWALTDIFQSCSTCPATSRARPNSPLIIGSTNDCFISLFNNRCLPPSEQFYNRKIYIYIFLYILFYFSNVVHTPHTHILNPCYFAMPIPSLKHRLYVLLRLSRWCSCHFMH